MFDAGPGMFRIDVVRVNALESPGHRGSHAALYQRVFAETLPHSRPALVAAEVEGRGEHPRDAAGTCLVCAYLAGFECERVVE